jgi:hypothetical protein
LARPLHGGGTDSHPDEQLWIFDAEVAGEPTVQCCRSGAAVPDYTDGGGLRMV